MTHLADVAHPKKLKVFEAKNMYLKSIVLKNPIWKLVSTRFNKMKCTQPILARKKITTN
jgi:hypothetical protein